MDALAEHADDRMGRIAWKALATLSAVGAAMLTRRLVASVWRRFAATDPPLDPSEPDVGWTEALWWGAAAGAGAGLARVLGRRTAVGVWQSATGQQPPDE